jgi:signal transduction histidine kinase
MNIRWRVIALVASLFAVLIAIEIVIQERVFMPSFQQLERSQADTSMRRIRYALDRSLEGLQLNDQEWSNWGELYQYMRDFNPAFIATYSTAEAMAPLKSNVLLLVDMQGKYVFSVARDWATGAPLAIELAARSALPEDFPWRTALAAGKPVRGLLRTSQGVMMLAGAPIFNGSANGEPRGMTIMGRLLTPEQLRQIGTEAQVEVSMLRDAALAPRDGNLVETDRVTRVFGTFADVYDKPVLALQIEVPRNITARGYTAVRYSLWYLVGAAVTVLVLVLVILNRVVLAPIARVTRHAVAVGEGDDLSVRLAARGSDEVAQLAREFDRMVENVAESRQRHLEQSYQAGFAELAKGVLHNLGNAMTPLEVRLSLLAARLRSAPHADVLWAANELAGKPRAADAGHTQAGDSDTAALLRRADLLSFVELGCREIAAAARGAHEDIDVMQRQTAIMRAVLAEQLPGKQFNQRLESVLLPELVAQSLDLVPDACRQRIVVEMDESLRAVGPVPVARTALRLILQNLIINAADAVRDAGRERGTLRFSAELRGERERETAQLCLHARDDGIGIAADDLPRIFERGFRAKPESSHQGIGLDWCANALRSLGGSISASSEGRGRGATMHITLPVDGRETAEVESQEKSRFTEQER